MTNIFDQIDAKAYENKLPYSPRSKDRAVWEAYKAENDRLYDQFKKDLFEFHGVISFPKKVLDKAFSIAWDSGHSSGWNEIALYFNDLADLIKLAAEK